MNKVIKSLSISLLSILMFVAFLVPIKADSTPKNTEGYIEEGFSKIIAYNISECQFLEVYGMDG